MSEEGKDSKKKPEKGGAFKRAKEVTKEDMDEAGAQAVHPGRGWTRRGDDRRTAK